MSRRHLTYVAVVIASIVVSACADVTAPRGDTPIDSTDACKGFVLSGGKTCTP